MRVFKIGCAIWGKGEARDYSELYQILSEVNARRCAPPMEERRVESAARSIVKRYPRGAQNPEGV